jgi:hypothetical protein
MPNWCDNSIQVTHENPEMMEKFIKSFNNSTLFKDFFPMPENYNDWYAWAVEEWGTKWDIQIQDSNMDDNIFHGYFDTAWSPPISAYHKFANLGFIIDATFHENGLAFIGTWSTKDGERYYEYDFSDENWREGLPPDMVSMLESDYIFYLECNEEPEDEP